MWTEIAGNHIYRSSGNVGIGSASPGEKLDVVGNIKASGSIEGNTVKVSSLNSSSNHNKVLMINSNGEIDICNNVSSSGGGGTTDTTYVVAKQGEMRVSHDKANVKEFTHYE